MRFRLTPRSMTVDDLELLSVQSFERIAGISLILEATTTKRMNIEPATAL